MNSTIPEKSNLIMNEIPFCSSESGNSDTNVHAEVEQPTYSSIDNNLQIRTDLIQQEIINQLELNTGNLYQLTDFTENQNKVHTIII